VPAASLSIARWYADDVIARGPVTPQDGVVRVSDRPGLGVTLAPVALRRWHARHLAQGAFPGGRNDSYGAGFGKL